MTKKVYRIEDAEKDGSNRRAIYADLRDYQDKQIIHCIKFKGCNEYNSFIAKSTQEMFDFFKIDDVFNLSDRLEKAMFNDLLFAMDKK